MNQKKSNKVTDQKLKKERRAFLKKSVYKAPALIVLGSLAKPIAANALGSPPNPEPKVW